MADSNNYADAASSTSPETSCADLCPLCSKADCESNEGSLEQVLHPASLAVFANTSLSRLLRSGKDSDVTIECGGQKWSCHKDIISRGCPFFRACCGGDFLVSDTRFCYASC